MMSLLSVTVVLLVCRTGWCAATPLFVKTDSDVTLNVTDVPGYDVFSWKFNTHRVILRHIPGRNATISQNYIGRVKFSLKNYSVRLMSLQKADSGVYTAERIGTEKTDVLAEYAIRVEDPVTPVAVTVDSVSSGSDSCNLTVSCRTQDAHINSTITCDRQTCSQEEGERSVNTSSGASLTVHLVNDSILCNHSNQVSWTSNTKMVKPVCAIDAGWCAVTPLFIKTGSDVTLNVTDVPGDYIVISWTFNGKTNLVTHIPGGKTTISQNYTGRVEFSLKNYSVRLMSLQKADSGVYTAEGVGQKKSVLAEYAIRVEYPVSPVEVTVDSVSSGSDSCNLTVSCRTQDAHINSTITCDRQTCSQEEGQRSVNTFSGASLNIRLVNDLILCNHSNQVSWTNNTMMVKPVCAIDAGSEHVSGSISVCLVKAGIFSIGLIIMVSALISVHIMDKFKKQK